MHWRSGGGEKAVSFFRLLSQLRLGKQNGVISSALLSPSWMAWKLRGRGHFTLYRYTSSTWSNLLLCPPSPGTPLTRCETAKLMPFLQSVPQIHSQPPYILKNAVLTLKYGGLYNLTWTLHSHYAIAKKLAPEFCVPPSFLLLSGCVSFLIYCNPLFKTVKNLESPSRTAVYKCRKWNMVQVLMSTRMFLWFKFWGLNPVQKFVERNKILKPDLQI